MSTSVRRSALACFACLVLSSLSAGGGSAQPAPSTYLPMFEQARWVLRNPRQAAPVVFEIPKRDGDGYRIVSKNPWGSSEWTLVDQQGSFVMTVYGADGKTMPLTAKPVWVDFNRPDKSRWSNMLGDFEIVSRSASVKTASQTYTGCVQMRHTPKGAGGLVYTFAPGVGFVQFGAGDLAFVLDEAASNLPGAAKTAAPTARNIEPPPRTKARRYAVGGALIGLTPNRLATEPNSPEVLVRRFNQTVDLGVSFVVGNATWRELEPKPGEYSLASLNYLISSSSANQLPISFAIRAIDTIHKGVPADLQDLPWHHPTMKSRAVRLIETLAPVMRGHVRWLEFGYEVDGYFDAHPKEADSFAELHAVVAARVKQLVPDMPVSTTVTLTAIDRLTSRLAGLNKQLDFLALTYTPIEPGFTVKDPSVLPDDFRKMKQIAGKRKIVLQEIAYPSSPLTKGSDAKQARFYELAFDELAKNDGTFSAVNFMMLADLADADADQFASFYGMKGQQTFRALLQTLGMFDVHGRPKPSWQVFTKRLQAGSPL